MIKKKAEKILTYKDTNSAQWNVKAKVIPEEGQLEPQQNHTATYRESTKSRNFIYIGHYTHTSESANVKVQNILHMPNNMTRSTTRKYKKAAILYTLTSRFPSGI